MVFVLNKNKKDSKGIIVFNSAEAIFFRKKFIEKIYTKEINMLKRDYFFFMHWSWALRNEATVPYIDYHLAPIGGGSFQNKKANRIINYSSRNFIDKIFRKKNYKKVYDVISVLRPTPEKGFKSLINAASKVYKKKKFVKFLIIFPMVSDKDFYGQPNKFYTDLIKDYKNHIKKEHRKYFTLLPINTFDGDYMLAKEQMCNFYNLSKICILPSLIEGGNRAIHEALLCGCPIIYYKNVVGGVADYMEKNNSISYSSESDLPNKILKALKNFKFFKINQKKTKQLVSEEYQIPKFRKLLNKIYSSNKLKFDKTIDLKELDRKLDSHKINLPKNLRMKKSNHIKDFISFYKYICILLNKRPSILKLTAIVVLQSIFLSLRFLKYEIYIKLRYR
tara:strand:+ start:822 stop:1994 length:1173 start_codon:yes stop_codon:yes gene_type:complete